MLRTSWKSWWMGAAAGAMAACTGSTTWAQSAPRVTPPVAVRTLEAVAEQVGDVLFLVDADDDDTKVRKTETLPSSDYWIGIALGELPEIAREQLKLEEGLVVADVMADSPAAKAEFKTNDILIKAGDARLKAAADLIKAVEAAQEKELAIVVVRGGKEQVVRVTPIKRPKSEAAEYRDAFTLKLPTTEIRADIKADIAKLEEALTKLKEKTGNAPLGLMFTRPAVVPPMARATLNLKAAELPKNVTISITKKGDEPAKIHIEKDGKTWETTEDKLGELPEDIREHVQQFHGGQMRFRTPMGLPGMPAVPGVRYESSVTRSAPVAPAPPAPPATGAPPAPAAPPAPPTAPVPPTPARAAIRAYVQPYTYYPSTTPAPARVESYRIERADGGVDGKLDAIMKKLDQLESKSVEQLEREVKQLRKELDELRSKSSGERDGR